jgi:hypothetical protein
MRWSGKVYINCILLKRSDPLEDDDCYPEASVSGEACDKSMVMERKRRGCALQ